MAPETDVAQPALRFGLRQRRDGVALRLLNDLGDAAPAGSNQAVEA